MHRLSYADQAREVMLQALLDCRAKGLPPHETAVVINAAYPFGERRNWPYRAWLRERRTFFATHNLPRNGDYRLSRVRKTDLVGQLLPQEDPTDVVS